MSGNDFGNSQNFVANTQLSETTLIKSVDAMGDMILGAIASKLDAMTENLKDKFSKGMGSATAAVNNATSQLSVKADPTPPMTPRSQQIESPEKTPEIQLSKEHNTAMANIKESLGKHGFPQGAVESNVDQAASNSKTTAMSQSHVQTQSMGIGV